MCSEDGEPGFKRIILASRGTPAQPTICSDLHMERASQETLCDKLNKILLQLIEGKNFKDCNLVNNGCVVQVHKM